MVGVDVYGDDMAGDRGDRHSRRRSLSPRQTIADAEVGGTMLIHAGLPD
ncbi:hypothetical protein X743_32575 [Mesorhizobium sp. LNHC252B00]|nr:hypothetical protein X743_32575 [Mesorhizobium sp. LNHC252B00]